MGAAWERHAMCELVFIRNMKSIAIMERGYAAYLRSSKPRRLYVNQNVAFTASYANMEGMRNHVYLETPNINSI